MCDNVHPSLPRTKIMPREGERGMCVCECVSVGGGECVSVCGVRVDQTKLGVWREIRKMKRKVCV